MVSAASARRRRCQQPLGEERPLAQLGHRHVQRADPGVQVPVPVPVAPVGPLRVTGAVVGAAHRVGLRRQQRVDERGQQLPHQIRAGLGQLAHAGTGQGRYLARRSSRCSFFEAVVRDHSKDHPMTATYMRSDTVTGCSYTTLPDSTLWRETLGVGAPLIRPGRTRKVSAPLSHRFPSHRAAGGAETGRSAPRWRINAKSLGSVYCSRGSSAMRHFRASLSLHRRKSAIPARRYSASSSR